MGSVAPVVILLVGRVAGGGASIPRALVTCWLFTLCIMGFAVLSKPRHLEGAMWAWRGWWLPAVLVLSGALLGRFSDALDLGAWLLVAGAYVALADAETILTVTAPRLRSLMIRLCIAALAGVLPVALSQIEGRFSEEEFFALVQAGILGAYWIALRAAMNRLSRGESGTSRTFLRVHRPMLGLVLSGLVYSGGILLVRGYQDSFYTATVPDYSGITASEPFICGSTPKQPSVIDGAEVHRKLLNSVAANPNKGTAEYGMLALGMRSADWAVQFREALIADAGQELYAGPAHSVKYQQYLASQRLYYYLMVQREFPELFLEADQVVLHKWFTSINERALTSEWVDVMYGLAFTKWPEGPYENQETGAALLSLMEYGQISSGDLSLRNRSYLSRSPKGWVTRFANTDDAFVYQSDWITNAYLQSLWLPDVSQDNIEKSFEWMLLQLLPDGTPLSYNHPAVAPLAGQLYLGAVLLDDPRYVWLADAALNALTVSGGYVRVQPGAEVPVAIQGTAPDQGSCLVYADSGLPNQVGPLAPDKVVLRDGWDPDDPYVLINLRFTGWHRYKGTASIPFVYWGRTISQEALSGSPYRWLPEGRSLFRDKRIPRENLNGMTVERTGFSAVLYSLTGWGGEWAQDPPYYAEVVAFAPGREFDVVHIEVPDWRGWTQNRWVYLFHDHGPVVVIDSMAGPPHRGSALMWQLPGNATVEGTTIALPDEDRRAELEVLCLWGLGECSVDIQSNGVGSRARWLSDGPWTIASMFLFGDWVGSDVTYDHERQGLVISGPSGELQVDLEVDTLARNTD